MTISSVQFDQYGLYNELLENKIYLGNISQYKKVKA